MQSVLCTSDTVAQEVLAKRRELHACASTGIMTDALLKLGVHESHAYDAFVKEAPEHKDLLLFVSDKVANREMDSSHNVAYRVHPVTNERVYATAKDFENLKPMEPERHENLMVVRHDVWRAMSEEARTDAIMSGQVVVTRLPANETLRSAGFRNAQCAKSADDHMTDEKTETALQSGPVAFLNALGVSYHEDHYCLRPERAEQVKDIVRMVCKLRGVKAGILVVPHGRCAATVSSETLDSVVTRVFPGAMSALDVQAVRDKLDTTNSSGDTNLVAHFPGIDHASGAFVTMPLLDLQLEGDRWTAKNTHASFDRGSKTWTLRRLVQ